MGGIFVRYLYNKSCWFIYIFQIHKIGRYPSRAQKRNRRFLFYAVGHRKDFKVPYRYVAYTYLYKKIPWDDLKSISRYLTFLMNFHTMFTDKIDEQRYILSGNS